MNGFIGNDSRRRWISSRPCFRCGQGHTFGQCQALNAKCYSCFQTGHFRKVCKNNETQIKSKRTRERDTERMTAFISRKTAESLPFSFITNEELSNCFLKYPGIHENYRKQLQEVHVSAARIETELLSKQENLERQLQELQKSASREKADFISNQKNMNMKLEDAKNLELNLRRGRDSLQEKLFLEEYKLGKAEEKLATCEKRNTDLERESLELKKRVCFSETKLERLEIQLQDSKRVINLKTSELNEMTVQRNAVFRYFHEKDTHGSCEMKREASRQEFQWLLDSVCYRDRIRDRSSGHFECSKCGSVRYHSHASCIAVGNVCGLCHKPNHFSHKCRSARMTTNDTPSWLLDLLNELAEKLQSDK